MKHYEAHIFEESFVHPYIMSQDSDTIRFIYRKAMNELKLSPFGGYVVINFFCNGNYVGTCTKYEGEIYSFKC